MRLKYLGIPGVQSREVGTADGLMKDYTFAGGQVRNVEDEDAEKILERTVNEFIESKPAKPATDKRSDSKRGSGKKK